MTNDATRAQNGGHESWLRPVIAVGEGEQERLPSWPCTGSPGAQGSRPRLRLPSYVSGAPVTLRGLSYTAGGHVREPGLQQSHRTLPRTQGLGRGGLTATGGELSPGASTEFTCTDGSLGAP